MCQRRVFWGGVASGIAGLLALAGCEGGTAPPSTFAALPRAEALPPPAAALPPAAPPVEPSPTNGAPEQSLAQLVALQAPAAEPTSPAAQPGEPLAQGGATALIPRKVFFGNPERARARLSPNGERLAFVAPVEGVLNVWVGPAADPSQAKPITHDRDRGIAMYFWAYTNDHILYTKDEGGDEDFHLYAVDLKTGSARDLTPIKKISAQVEGVSEKFPQEILVGINDRGERHFHDVYRVNLATGERQLWQENPGFAGFVIDDDYRVRFAATFTPDGGQLYLQADGQAPGGWKDFLKIDPLDAMTTGLAGFDKSGEKIYLLDSRQRDTAALFELELATGKTTLLAENPRADISGVIAHPTEKHVQAVSFTYAREEWVVLDRAIQPDLDYLKTVADGELQITGRTLDDRWWTVAYVMDNGPVKFFIYDRQARQARYLFTSTPALEKLPLAKMHPVVIKSRDGLNLVSYLTLPPASDPQHTGRPNRPLPLVLLVHGGPWARDEWGYDPEHQLWANRGYAVLAVNYRGSTGFGKNFVNAADREWAGKMHLDLLDAVEWAVQEKIALREKIAITGASYGGYATLVGLTFTPDVFACGVDVVGPSSLITLLENPPPYWMPFMPVMKKRVGDHQTEEGRSFLASRSPLSLAEKIQRPLLIGQGANDPRVKQAEADQIVAAMQAKKIPVTYLLFPQEGHGFDKPENRFAFYAVAEAFLARHLGGQCEPVGTAFTGAQFTVPAGGELLPPAPPGGEPNSTAPPKSP